MAYTVRTIQNTPVPNNDTVRLYGTPLAVTNVCVGTKFVYVGEGERDFPTAGTRLMPVPTGTILRLTKKFEGIHNWLYEFHQNSDQACGRLRGRWLSAPKLAEMINNESMFQVPQALRVQHDASRM